MTIESRFLSRLAGSRRAPRPGDRPRLVLLRLSAHRYNEAGDYRPLGGRAASGRLALEPRR